MSLNEDLISRSALLEAIAEGFFKTDPTGEEQLGYLACSRIVRGFPTVDAEVVRHGYWIHPKDHVVTNEFFCSECNKRTVSLRTINRQANGMLVADENGNFYYPPTMKYCSECGCKMDGDVNAAD